MAWYRSGTVNVTNGSVNVVGVGTSFVANVSIGEGFLGPDGRVYEVADVPSNTALTLAAGYQGATANAQGYAILPTQSALADLAAEAAELVASFAAVRDGPGAGLFPDGTAGAPAIRFAADQDTGFYRIAANQFGAALGGVLVAGFLGTSSEIFRLRTTAGRGTGNGFLSFYDPTGRKSYIGHGGADDALFMMNEMSDKIIFGTGAAERMRISADGKVGIGTTTPALALDVAGDIRGDRYTFRQSTATPAGDAGIHRPADNSLAFITANTERARFDANGKLDLGGLLGAGAPIERLNVNGSLVIGGLIGSTTGLTALSLHYNGAGKICTMGSLRGSSALALGYGVKPSEAASDGWVSSIASALGRASFEMTNSAVKFGFAGLQTVAIGDAVAMATSLEVSPGGTRPGADNTYELGAASLRWTQLFAATSTIGTSDEREKTWRGELTDDEYAAGLRVIDELGFFQWNDAVAEKGDDARYHFGARAQRVWGIFADAGLVDPIGKNGKPGRTPYSFLCYDAWEAEHEPVYEERTRTRQVPTAELYKSGKNKGKPKTVTVDEPYVHDTGKTRKVRDAGDRFGLRQSDLALFLVAVQSRRQAEIEKRLAALEKPAKR